MPKPLISNQEKRAEIGRELSRRKRVYPHLVRMGHLTKAEASKRIAALQSLANELRGMP